VVTLQFFCLFFLVRLREKLEIELQNCRQQSTVASYLARGSQCPSSSSVTVYARPHHYAVCCYCRSMVCLSVGYSMSRAKTVEPIEMPFALWTQVGPRNYVSAGVPRGWAFRAVIRVHSIPIYVHFHSFPFQFVESYSIPAGFPFPLGILFPRPSLLRLVLTETEPVHVTVAQVLRVVNVARKVAAAVRRVECELVVVMYSSSSRAWID